MHFLHIVGARPNFMKAAPVLRALAALGAHQTLVHTGQHYDAAMSDVFFQQLEMSAPDVNLAVGSGSHAQQTAEILSRIEPILIERNPTAVVVYGDVNSTVAAALAAAKLQIPVAHVEAGLRSRDRTMPEEINRLITDQLSDFLFTPSVDGDANLLREGIAAEKIHCVGNVMIDTLVRLLPQAKAPQGISGRYALVTLHRPGNVDDLEWLAAMLTTLRELSRDLEIIFPAHPRTRQRLESLGTALAASSSGGALRVMDPLPYLEFLALQRNAAVVITDSGGIQEETTYLGVPCLTVRENTERPITVTHGTNCLVGRSLDRLKQEARRVLDSPSPKPQPLPLWDGKASDRIAQILQEHLGG